MRLAHMKHAHYTCLYILVTAHADPKRGNCHRTRCHLNVRVFRISKGMSLLAGTKKKKDSALKRRTKGEMITRGKV